MAYRQLEELTSRKREKVAMFFTAEHMAGVLAIGLPAYVCTLGTTFWLRLAILLLAAVLGLVITSDVNGMAGYERALWWVRGRLRRQFAGRTLRPLEFAAAPPAQRGRAIPLGRPVRRLKREDDLHALPSAPLAVPVARHDRLHRPARTAAAPGISAVPDNSGEER